MTEQIEIKKITPADFNQGDINEVSSYLNNAVGFSEVLTRFYTLTDKIDDKAKVFMGIYRVLSSCWAYTENKDLKEKLNIVLQNTKVLYRDVSVIIDTMNYSKVNFGMHIYRQRLNNLMFDNNNMENVHIITDLFILFAEKQIKYNLNKITGVDLETPEGKEVMKEIYSSAKDSPINDSLIKVEEQDQSEDIEKIEEEIQTELKSEQ